jgi:hypothetical protein
MLPFWYRQIDLILDGREGPVPFGRMQDDPARLAGIERDRLLPAAKLFDRIEAGIQPYWWRLPRLSETEVACVGLHPTRGEMTIPEIIEVLVVGHAESHVIQLREALAAT